MSLLHAHKTGENVPKWIVLIRLVLGVCLILKAIKFFSDQVLIGQLEQYFRDSSMLKNFVWMIHFVPWIHIIGGILIIIGLFTRLASLLQLPILIGAVFFINLKNGLYGGEADLPLSILVLVLTIFFSIEGAGYYSLDNSIRKPVDRK